jgi:hypothetical protein
MNFSFSFLFFCFFFVFILVEFRFFIEPVSKFSFSCHVGQLKNSTRVTFVIFFIIFMGKANNIPDCGFILLFYFHQAVFFSILCYFVNALLIVYYS